MESVTTRDSTKHSVLGQPAVLKRNQLPTSADVYRQYDYFLKHENYDSVQKRAASVAQEVISIYSTASIPTIDEKSVVNRIKKLLDTVKDLAKYPSSKKTSITYQDSLKSLETVFDICTCKCVDSGVLEKSQCTCPLLKKIPAAEWSFWLDQKTERRMYIGAVDKKATAKLKKKEMRAFKRIKFEHKQRDDKSDDADDADRDDDLELQSNTGDDVSGCEISNSDSDDCAVAVRNMKQYPELCKALDRCKISNRDACLVVNAVLKDMNLLSAETAVDPAKLRRQRSIWRQKIVSTHGAQMQELLCIGFDGKQDSTFVEISGLRRCIKEEHYVIISFPNNNYIDHVVPQTSKAEDIANEILSVIANTNSASTLQAVVCDGTVNNTGKRNGVIRRLEEGITRPLQWLVCLLHTNELPFRKYISVIDGGFTTGPTSSTGAIMSALEFDPKDLPIAQFNAIPGKVIDVIDEVKKDLSTDQIYLLRACLAVQQGYEDKDEIKFLQNAMPGNLNHARWLTKASRILRLYMSKQSCSSSLRKIVHFIVNVYAPSWFNIKSHPCCADGAKNFFYLLKRCHELGAEDWKILEPVLQNNCYFAHCENILLAGVYDNDNTTRNFCLDKIITLRSNSCSSVRVFDKSTIKFNANALTYVDMIDWTTADLTPPPLLAAIDNDNLQHCQFDYISGIPCHSQAVERAVKDISAACSTVYGHESRHGMILQCTSSRADLPSVDCKSDFL